MRCSFERAQDGVRGGPWGRWGKVLEEEGGTEDYLSFREKKGESTMPKRESVVRKRDRRPALGELRLHSEMGNRRKANWGTRKKGFVKNR